MLKITALIALIAASAGIIPAVEAGFWVHLFPTCLSPLPSENLLTPLSKILYVTTPSEPTVCTPQSEFLQYTYSFVATSDNSILKTPCNDANTGHKEDPETYTKFTGGLQDCTSQYVFFPIASTGSKGGSISTLQMLNSLPPVDWMVAATAIMVKHYLNSIPQGDCVSKALAYSELIPVWESCANLPHKQGSVYSNYTDQTDFDYGETLHNQRYILNDCKGPTITSDGYKYPPASGGDCKDERKLNSGMPDKRPAIVKFPGWPLEKTSIYPTDKSTYTIKRSQYDLLPPTDFDGEYLLYPFNYKDDLSKLPTPTTNDFPIKTATPTAEAFDPAVIVKPAVVIDNSFDAYPIKKTTPGAVAGVGGSGKNSGGVERFAGGVVGVGLALKGSCFDGLGRLGEDMRDSGAWDDRERRDVSKDHKDSQESLNESRTRMLKITPIIALVASTSSLIPAVSAGYWFHSFQTCFTPSSKTATPEINVFYATTESEPAICSEELSHYGYSYTIINENTIGKQLCDQKGLPATGLERPEVLTRFTGGPKDCDLGELVFWPIPSKTEFAGITARDILNQLPPVDFVGGATAAKVTLGIKSTSLGYCASRSLSVVNIVPIFESCAKLPHKQGSLLTTFLSSEKFENTRFTTDDCTGSSKFSTSYTKPRPSNSTVTCENDDLGKSFGPIKPNVALLNFPGWPLDKSSKIPSDQPDFVTPAPGSAQVPFANVDDETVFYPLNQDKDVNPRNGDPKPIVVEVPVKPQVLIDGSFDGFGEEKNPSAATTVASVTPVATSKPAAAGTKPNGAERAVGVSGAVASAFVAVVAWGLQLV
ncbi:hypothetical protein HDU97_008408 [Phlyctochytrium planicorne]|nr:hypothetical protein HDU97_008408 [Phlyctochytrium planicorne]